MKWLAVSLLVTLTCGQLFAIDESAMLQAISIKEDSCGKVGKSGEQGCYQLMPVNVKKYGGYQREHALAMLRDVVKDLEVHKVWVSSYNIALYWNCGPHAMRGGAPYVSYRYALEVEQIYNRLTIPSSGPAR